MTHSTEEPQGDPGRTSMNKPAILVRHGNHLDIVRRKSRNLNYQTEGQRSLVTYQWGHIPALEQSVGTTAFPQQMREYQVGPLPVEFQTPGY